MNHHHSQSLHLLQPIVQWLPDHTFEHIELVSHAVTGSSGPSFQAKPARPILEADRGDSITPTRYGGDKHKASLDEAFKVIVWNQDRQIINGHWVSSSDWVLNVFVLTWSATPSFHSAHRCKFVRGVVARTEQHVLMQLIMIPCIQRSILPQTPTTDGRNGPFVVPIHALKLAQLGEVSA